MSTLRSIRNPLLGAAIAAALGFGGNHLFAERAGCTEPTCANVPCELEACDRCCQALFPGPITSGFCGPEGECRCAV
jgi:hypothetical protein